MLLTVNFVDKSRKFSPCLLASCTMQIGTKEPDKVKKAYTKALNSLANGYTGNGAQLMQDATDMVMCECPDMCLLAVTDSPYMKAGIKDTLVVEMSRKRP